MASSIQINWKLPHENHIKHNQNKLTRISLKKQCFNRKAKLSPENLRVTETDTHIENLNIPKKKKNITREWDQIKHIKRKKKKRERPHMEKEKIKKSKPLEKWRNPRADEKKKNIRIWTHKQKIRRCFLRLDFRLTAYNTLILSRAWKIQILHILVASLTRFKLFNCPLRFWTAAVFFFSFSFQFTLCLDGGLQKFHTILYDMVLYYLMEWYYIVIDKFIKLFLIIINIKFINNY